MSFGPLKFTSAGRALMLGALTSQAPESLTALLNPLVTMDIASIRRSGQYVSLRGSFTNAGLLAGFYWREVGLFAVDPETGADVLYCYQNAYDLAEYIAAAGSEIIEKTLTLIAQVGDAPNVSIVVNGSLIYLTQEDLDAHDADQNAHAELIAVHNSDGDAHSVIMRQKADLGANGKLVDWELGDIDCGYFDEAAADPVALHDQSPTVHMRMAVDGNTAAPADTSATLEEHVVNPLAHQNIDLDGNEN